MSLMPCSIGMRACRAACAHRRLVHDYYAAREAAELQRESVAGGYPTETAEYGAVLTFKDYITALASTA